MSLKLPRLCLLLALLCPCWAKEQPCRKSATSCDECVQSGPDCAWCTVPNGRTRCHTSERLRRAGCLKRHMYNPRGRVEVVKNDSVTDGTALFLQPQEFSVHLRPGVSQSFPISVTVPPEQPVTDLTMDTSSVPAGVNISFGSIIKGNPLLIKVSVEAAQCPSSDRISYGPWSVHITPRGFSQSVKLEITLECQCNCEGTREENSPACSGHGDLVCGQCECQKPYVGEQCQTDSDSLFSEDDSSCRSGPNDPVCSNRGKCVGGFCECEQRENPKERFSGQFCECSNFDCPYFNNRICGGNGRCECGNCVCDDGWTNEDCSCSMETASCMGGNQMLCNGRGICQCGLCQCDPPYTGPTCEHCPDCVGTCQKHAACVECRAFGTGPKTNTCDSDCGYLTVTVVDKERDVPTTNGLCKMRNEDDCVLYYSVSGGPSGGRATAAKECYS
ncbi:integrin beta-1-like [Mugil cephalus]|uniref:integrin beta-1-like n=1 Tax=Mugil cephalus TaxID=48193 RepID=UPI001FB6C1C5|nr:integrin beta-1-like [Mugil cephalus]